MEVSLIRLLRLVLKITKRSKLILVSPRKVRLNLYLFDDNFFTTIQEKCSPAAPALSQAEDPPGF